jgi:hypothetical protein
MKFGFKGWVFGLLAVSASNLFAGTAEVDVWVKDAATGRPVKDAFLVVTNGEDTVATASSKTTAASRFQLNVTASAVEGRESADMGPEKPLYRSVVEAYPNPCDDRLTLAVADPDGDALRIAILNVLGQRVYSGQVRTNPGEGAALDMRLKNVGSGLYRHDDGPFR